MQGATAPLEKPAWMRTHTFRSRSHELSPVLGPTLLAAPAAAHGGEGDRWPVEFSSASLSRFAVDEHALSCLDAMPRAPVLLRLLQLDHAVLPDLTGRTALVTGHRAHCARHRPPGAASAAATGSRSTAASQRALIAAMSFG